MNNDISMTLNPSKEQQQTWMPWLIWSLAAIYFFCEYFARVSPGVMGRQLQVSLGITTTELGLLSSFFYYPYISMQLPVGLMVDRYSVRWLLTFMGLLTAVGCTLFGLSSGLWSAALGRVLIGFSAAFAFVSALKLASSWFPPSKLGLLAGLTQALGMWGASVGEAPVSYLVSMVGWRHTMLWMAFIFIVLAILICRFVKDSPTANSYTRSKKAPAPMLGSLKEIFSNKQTWFNALYAGFLFAPTAIFAEFWGPSYLQYAKGMGAHSAAFADGLIFIGWGLGGPCLGYFSDKFGLRKPFMYASALSGVVILSMILFIPKLALWQLNLLFFLYGLTNSGVGIAYAVATEINRRAVVGASIAFANMSSVIIGALLQPVFGKWLEWTIGHPVHDIANLMPADFQYAVLLLPACSILALLTALKIKETHCHPVDTFS